MMTVTLPLPPSTNALYRNVPGKGRVKTSAYHAWAEDAGYHVRMAWRRLGQPDWTGKPLSLAIEAGLTGRKRDLSNTVKATEDLLVQCCEGLPDDCWNDDIRMARNEALAGFCRVTIGPITPP